MLNRNEKGVLLHVLAAELARMFGGNRKRLLTNLNRWCHGINLRGVRRKDSKTIVLESEPVGSERATTYEAYERFCVALDAESYRIRNGRRVRHYDSGKGPHQVTGLKIARKVVERRKRHTENGDT